MEDKKGTVKIILPNHRWIEEHNKKPQEFIVHLLWAELEFDIKYQITKRAKLAGADKNKDLSKNFTFTASDEDWLLRTIDEAVGNVKAKLSAACENAGRFASDELLEKPLDYDVIFKFEGDTKWLGSPYDLMNYIHQYVVNFAVSEWLDMEGSAQSATSMAKAEDALQKAYNEIHLVLIETPKFIL